MLKYIHVGVEHEGSIYQMVLRADGKGGLIRNPDREQPERFIMMFGGTCQDAIEALRMRGVPMPSAVDVSSLLEGILEPEPVVLPGRFHVVAEFKGGYTSCIPVAEVEDMNRIFSTLDGDVNCERVRVFNSDGFDITHQRYDLE